MPSIEGIGSQAFRDFRARVEEKRREQPRNTEHAEAVVRASKTVAKTRSEAQSTAIVATTEARAISAFHDSLRHNTIVRDFQRALAGEDIEALAVIRDSLSEIIDFFSSSLDHFGFGISLLDLARSLHQLHAARSKQDQEEGKGGEEERKNEKEKKRKKKKEEEEGGEEDEEEGEEEKKKEEARHKFPTVKPLVGAEADVVGEIVLSLLNVARDHLSASRKELDDDAVFAAATHGLACALVEIEWCRLRYVPELEIEIDELELTEIATNIDDAVELFKAAGKLRKGAGNFASTMNVAFAHFVHFEASKRSGGATAEVLEALLMKAASYNTLPEIRDFFAAKLFDCRVFFRRQREQGTWSGAFRKLTPYGEEHLHEVYSLIDKDEDGFLDYDDTTGLLRLPVEDFYSITRSCETSSEGSLNFSGFAQFLSLMLERDLVGTFAAFAALGLSVTTEAYGALDSGRPRTFSTAAPGACLKLEAVDEAKAAAGGGGGGGGGGDGAGGGGDRGGGGGSGGTRRLSSSGERRQRGNSQQTWATRLL